MMRNPMNNLPSFARCVLHLRAIHRNPSRVSFYVRGILREFDNIGGAICVACFAFICFAFGVNLFF